MTKKASPSFSQLAAEYRAVNIVADDNSVDEETSFKFFVRGCKIAKKMTAPDVAITGRSEEIELAKIIRDEICGDYGVFADTLVEAFVVKLLNNIIGSDTTAHAHG
jgi:hypothetical protein